MLNKVNPYYTSHSEAKPKNLANEDKGLECTQLSFFVGQTLRFAQGDRYVFWR